MEKDADAIRGDLALIEERKRLLLERIASMKTKKESLNTAMTDLAARKADCEQRKAVLDGRSAEMNSSDAEMIRLEELMRENEEAKEMELKVKAELMQRMELLRKRNDAAAEEAGGATTLVEARARLHQAQDDLSIAAREVVFMEKKLSLKCRPDPMELVQYQRRMEELEQEGATRYSETLRFYDLFNTLEAQKVYLSRAISMMNSVLESLPRSVDASKSGISASSQRSHFLTSFEAMLIEVRQLKKNVQKELEEQDEKNGEASKELNVLLGYNRLYANLVSSVRTQMTLAANRSEQNA